MIRKNSRPRLGHIGHTGATRKFSVYDRRHSLSILALHNKIIYKRTKKRMLSFIYLCLLSVEIKCIWECNEQYLDGGKKFFLHINDRPQTFLLAFSVFRCTVGNQLGQTN